MNHFKRLIYSIFARIYTPESESRIFGWIASGLQGIFGFAAVKIGGVFIELGPVTVLDRFLLLGCNINPFLTSAISQHLAKGGTFLDIGANTGVLSLLAARNPAIKVIALEPSPRELKRLWRNLALNNFNNVSVFAFGVGELSETLSLSLSDERNTAMNSLPSVFESKSTASCHFAPVSVLFGAETLKDTKVCKIDVEGQEVHVLRSLKARMEALKSCVFVIEMSPLLLEKLGHKVSDIYDFFQDQGFKYQYGLQSQSQWEEIFYHPQSSCETKFDAKI